MNLSLDNTKRIQVAKINIQTINKVEPRPKVRSEAENSCFFQTGLKPMPKDASRRELSKSVLRIEKGALSAELRPFY